MHIMKVFSMGIAAAALALPCAAAPTVSDVVAQQRYPWNGLVDIDYTITGDSEWGTDLAVRVTDHDTGKVYAPTNWHKLPPMLAGRHRATWDTAADGLDVISTNMTVSITLFNCSNLYCVVDLSGGKDAEAYPVTELSAAPEGGWTDEYKTTKLVLRRIPAGTFIMGGGTTPESHRVTISRPFYVGVFQITQKQYKLVMGSNPSYYTGDKRPVDSVSYNSIRGSSAGAKWPTSSSVDATSFLGRLRTKTGLDGFDLPTDAQWEYVCRAGTTSTYNNGGDAADDLKTLGRYSGNTSDGRGGYSSYHTTVGSYAPNGWGLYDMHGNVWEWCRDWYGTLSYGIDPEGSSSGSDRVLRGGGWYSGAGYCTSSYRDISDPSYASYFLGFRLVRTLEQ